MLLSTDMYRGSYVEKSDMFQYNILVILDCFDSSAH